MKRNILIVTLTVVFVILLAACENSSAVSDNQSQNDNSTQNIIDDASSEESTDKVSNTDNTETDEKVDSSTNVLPKDEDTATNHEVSKIEEYEKKLMATKKETEEMEAASSTYALKKVESDRWDTWDELLNEIYGALMEQLPAEEMDQLREEQRNWIKSRDDSALEASLKYEGGTQEHLEYVSVLANLTEERCYELVERL